MPRAKKVDPADVAVSGMQGLGDIIAKSTPKEQPSEHVVMGFVELVKLLDSARNARIATEFAKKFTDVEAKVQSLINARNLAENKFRPQPPKRRKG